jgi:MFS family permease
MGAGTTVARRQRFFYGWVIVFGGFATHLLVAPTYAFGMSLFFNPIRNEMGWGAGVTSLAFSLRSFQSGVLAPFTGFLIDRFGSRTMMMAGMFMLGAGLMILSRIEALWQFYAAFLFIALGTSIGYGQAMNAALVNWFQKQRMRALGLMWAGGSVGGFMVPIVAFLLSHYGWRNTLLICGLAVWGMGIPIASLMRHRPEPYGLGPDGEPLAPEARVSVERRRSRKSPDKDGTNVWTVRKAIRTRTFWIIATAQGGSRLALGMVLTVHLIPFLESQGMSKSTAALIITVFSASSLPARLILGWIGDRVEKRLLITLVYGLNATAIIVLAASQNFWQAAIYGVMAGMARGAEAITDATLVSERFGTANFAAISGVLQSLGIFAGIVGPLLGGVMFDILGSYRPVFLGVGLLATLAAPLILLLPKQPLPLPAPARATS